MKFALIGVAGYIAPKHLRAIKETGNELVAACDVSDSVGILDSYFPDAEFFTEEIDFYSYCQEKEIDYLVICTPNYKHYDSLLMAETSRWKVVCEKPLVTDPRLLEHLSNDISIIQQLRLHPDIHNIKGEDINIVYHTPRGKWYHQSWKGKESLLINIGVHLFDLMYYLFGDLTEHNIKILTDKIAVGTFKAGNKNVTYDLSISGDKLIRDINGVDLSNIDLHTKSYEEILAGRGFKKETVKPVLEFIYDSLICQNT